MITRRSALTPLQVAMHRATLFICITIVLYLIYFAIYFFFEEKPLPVIEFPIEYQSYYSPKIDVAKNTNINVSWPKLLSSPPGEGLYPIYRDLLSIVKSWNPDQPDAPPSFYEALQHFNFSDKVERMAAERFRNAELPFKLYDVPDIRLVTELWTDEYLISKMANQVPHVEQSRTNHFMYWNMRGSREREYKPPTTVVKMKFQDWLAVAREKDCEKSSIKNSSSYYYFMTGALAGDRGASFVSRDLKCFSTEKNNFFITDVRANKGIQCRFGMRGIIAEAHYDSGRNMIAMVKGAKRYILTPPSTCRQLGIISDMKHPSYRHSVVDWSDVSQAESRGFGNVPAIDTIVRQGEILYVPSYWFHYIVSLEYSIQCNSRSGTPPGGNGKSDIEDCTGHAFSAKKRGKKNPKRRDAQQYQID